MVQAFHVRFFDTRGEELDNPFLDHELRRPCFSFASRRDRVLNLCGERCQMDR
jgi:hypothetical protein